MVFRRSRVTYPLFLPQKKWEERLSGCRASILRVFGLVYTPRFSILPPKEVGSKESGSRARAERVFGFACNPGSLFLLFRNGG
jgi:hypothetical protein